MRTKAQPYQLDESEKIIIASGLQMNSSQPLTPSSVYSTEVNNNNINNMTTQADSTSCDANNNNINSELNLNLPPSLKPGFADKCTQKNFDIDAQVRTRMQELGTQIYKSEYTHRYQVRKINEIQNANFELHRQNQTLYQLLAERRPDVVGRMTKRHHQYMPTAGTDQQHHPAPSSKSVPHIDLQQQQYYQYLQQQQQHQYLQAQQQAQLIQQQQQQQHSTYKQQHHNTQQYTAATHATHQPFDGNRTAAADAVATEVSKTLSSNSNVFVTQWTPQQQEKQSDNASPCATASKSFTAQLSHHPYQDAGNEQNPQLIDDAEEASKLAHPAAKLPFSSSSSTDNPAPNCTATMATSQQQQETQHLSDAYNKQYTVTHSTQSSLNVNSATNNAFVTPPPSPMLSPYTANASKQHRAHTNNAQQQHQQQAYFFPPGAHSPQFYYQKWPVNSNTVSKRQHPY